VRRVAIPRKTVHSIDQFVTTVTEDAKDWEPAFPWFRGEPANTPTPLTPKVFRPPKPGHHYDENNLLQTFRRRAHLLGLPIIPQRHEVDNWLFLARHVGLPTRLLDWTEGALIGLYFALLEKQPVVWMLNPHALNLKSHSGSLANVFPLTWVQPETNIGAASIHAAWQGGAGAVCLPVAVEPTNIHPRMNAQHSYFTVHGADKSPLSRLVGGDCLRYYKIAIRDRDLAVRELRMLGVAHSTILPDAEALAIELERFMTVAD
jgi:hypothetical protein